MTQKVQIAVGGESFEEIRKEKLYYVDKTELIYELAEQTNNKVTLFTRPRRFGKTLTMSMMESFFDITRDSRDYFDGLDVAKHTKFCEEWMNQYPVLFISFKDVDGMDFEAAFGCLKSALADMCKRISYLNSNNTVDIDDKTIFEKIKAQEPDVTAAKNSLKTIMRMMAVVYGKPAILLIDEYDVPLAKAQEKGYYAEMLDLIRGIMSISLKTNEYLKFAVVTGCLRIAKESIFTGVNNFMSYSVLDNRFSRYFGFSQDEIDQLLKMANLEEKTELFHSWYDGYIFGNGAVYCPWDVVSYVSDLLYEPETPPKNYWENTSSNGIIREFMGRDDFDVSRDFETLLNGGTVRKTITDSLTYDRLYESEENLWSVLFMTGYLTKADREETGNTVGLKIPNQEIARIFAKTVSDYFKDTVDKGRLETLMGSLWDGDEAAASDAFSELLWSTISYYDYHEDYYHAFLAGIFVGRGYACEPNKEHGLGRPDIMLTDKWRRRAIIIEAKKSEKESDLEKDCQKGIQQIIDNRYAEGLEGYRQVMCYGVAFFRKTALVKKL